jgi:hypothetical protein
VDRALFCEKCEVIIVIDKTEWEDHAERNRLEDEPVITWIDGCHGALLMPLDIILCEDAAVGALVGTGVGAADRYVGTTVGNAMNEVGSSVGRPDVTGTGVGSAVGTSVGTEVGSAVG